ncbi:hypothetical protein [Clostridium lundense]|uniref:hypothetical protein n=1 Tax=Clostridium lundense TaxID=319475 RepID=UPI00047FD464|nr:hypothetical protein [Clostridium lundense]
MSYTVLDLIDKIIYMIDKKKDICKSILDNMKKGTSVYILMSVFMKNLDTSAKYYMNLKKDVSIEDLDKIDFAIYDKMSFLMNEFNSKTIFEESTSVRDIIDSWLSFQKDALALYIDIQGRLVKNEDDVKTNTYKIIANMINQKKNYIKGLEDFAEKYS